MDREPVRRQETTSLLKTAAEGLDSVAYGLIGLHDQWAHAGGTPELLDCLRDRVADLGWWSGRLGGAADELESAVCSRRHDPALRVRCRR